MEAFVLVGGFLGLLILSDFLRPYILKNAQRAALWELKEYEKHLLESKAEWERDFWQKQIDECRMRHGGPKRT